MSLSWKDNYKSNKLSSYFLGLEKFLESLVPLEVLFPLRSQGVAEMEIKNNENACVSHLPWVIEGRKLPNIWELVKSMGGGGSVEKVKIGRGFNKVSLSATQLRISNGMTLTASFPWIF